MPTPLSSLDCKFFFLMKILLSNGELSLSFDFVGVALSIGLVVKLTITVYAMLPLYHYTHIRPFSECFWSFFFPLFCLLG